MNSAPVKQWLQKTPLGDQAAMLVFVFGGLFLLWYELSYIAAFNHADWSAAYLLHTLLTLFLAVNIYGNWAKLCTSKSVCKTGGAGEGLGWRYCACCRLYGPPRSHHCPLCQQCIVRHDHHCWFAGTCVGHLNQRYFLAMCAHMMLAGLYSNVYNWNYVRSVLEEVNLRTLLSLLIPHITVLLGRESWFSFWFNTLTMIGISLTAVFTWLFYRQLLQLIRGQTRFELQKGIRNYDQGWRRNVEEVLGRRRWWVLLWPWMPSAFPAEDLVFYWQQHKFL